MEMSSVDSRSGLFNSDCCHRRLPVPGARERRLIVPDTVVERELKNVKLFSSRSSLLLCCALWLGGCSEGLEKFPTAAATGTVTCNGQPVPNVRVYFSPIARDGAIGGKSGWGKAGDDGQFVINTYSDDDGAVIGSHNVTVDAPHPQMIRDFTCDCQTDGNKIITTVEVTSDGPNTFSIELPAKSRKGGKARSDDNADDDDE
jgi:hypothetical protein